MTIVRISASFTIFVALVLIATPSAQGVSQNDAYLMREMLRNAYETVKLHYYDPTFHGLDWDARYREFEDKLKAATSVDAGEVAIAQFLEGLKDSHTYFRPPPHVEVDYGYRLALVGNDTFVAQVRPGSDAAKKLTPGDRVISINGLTVDRNTFHTVQYILNTLAPRASTALALRSETGGNRTVVVTSSVRPRRIVRMPTNGNEIGDILRQQEDAILRLRSQHVEIGRVMIWKMPVFFASDDETDRLIGIARKHDGLVLDLRGNGGGRVDTLNRTVGGLFDHDVTIATRAGRSERQTRLAASRGRAAYTGKVVVLIDSGSASSSEVLARVVQLEHRGIVLGDRSAGAVMEARAFAFFPGNDPLVFYGFFVTDADVVMTDGHSLERVGVTPDELLLPSAQDLASGRDPVLSRAAQLVGLELDPAAAGKLFPFEWPVQ